MRRLVWSLTAIGLLAGQAYSAAPRQQPPAVPTDQALEAYRNDLQGAGIGTSTVDVIAHSAHLLIP